MIRITIKHDLEKLRKDLGTFAKQVPFAAALALNAVARDAVAAEQAAMRKDFDRPTPFTQRGVRMKPATKTNLTATVFIQDIQAKYLAPEIDGGAQVLGGSSRSIVTPMNIPLNSFGNLPKGVLAKLKARRDVFVGSVTFKKTGQTISGVWQRPPVGSRRQVGRGTKGNTQKMVDGVRTGLKLLIRFTEPVEVKTRYPWGAATQRAVATNFAGEFNKALAKAIATAKP